MVKFLIVQVSPRHSLELFQSEVGSVWGVFEYRKSSLGDFKFGSKVSGDEGQEDQLRGKQRIKKTSTTSTQKVVCVEIFYNAEGAAPGSSTSKETRW